MQKKKSHSRGWYGWLVPAVVILAGGIMWLVMWRAPRRNARAPSLPGYIGNLATVEREYARFHGKELKNPEVAQQFEQAAQEVVRHDYVGAATLLESAAKQAAVPVVFNDLGVVYGALNDRSRALNAFREALARDIHYEPVRDNLRRLEGSTLSEADPVTRELEPNNSNLLANVVGLGMPVEGAIAANMNDVDCFKITSPAAPRDTIAIRIRNNSPGLALGTRIYDSEMRLTDLARNSSAPGASIAQNIAPPPNTTLYLNVFGVGATGGSYTLTVEAMKAFDFYEPDDDIYSARPVTVGQTIEANIMDGQDTDFYSFKGPRTGTVSIEITNRSAGLIPALTTFSPDMRNSGFGPDIRTPGASLHHETTVEEGRTYFVQVWSQANSSGEYVLAIR
jgi:hypothetical protein